MKKYKSLDDAAFAKLGPLPLFIPADIYQRRDASPAVKFLAGYIYIRCYDGESIEVSIDHMADILLATPQTIHKSLSWLVHNEFIEITKSRRPDNASKSVHSLELTINWGTKS